MEIEAYGCYILPQDTTNIAYGMESGTYMISARCESKCHYAKYAVNTDIPGLIDKLVDEIFLAFSKAHMIL